MILLNFLIVTKLILLVVLQIILITIAKPLLFLVIVFIYLRSNGLTKKRDYLPSQNNPELINTEFDKYLAVTPAQVQAVANKYFASTNRTVLEVRAVAGKPTGGTR